MKQIQIIRAYNTISEVKDLSLPITISYKLSMLVKQLQPYIDASVECERKLVEKYNGSVDETGKVTFLNAQDKDNPAQEEILDAAQRASGFAREQQELQDQDIDAEIKPIRMKLTDAAETKWTVTQMLNLDGFVTFEDEEDE